MQVTHVQENITHAVIGGKEAREFGMSNSAEFFNILSNTLYSDKILAVVREVLCNAWDIHIETGITNKPVVITMTDDTLTIQDFGIGISDEDIVIVYGTYGNSTKKLDGKQTGGFGLGSKAPFAYADHFEVTSCHAGKKTLYAMSKSSGEVAGKPSITPIMTVPTDQTGLSVSLKIAPSDRQRFKDIIDYIARFGEMNVEYNGDIIPVYKFSEAVNGYMISNNFKIANSDAYRVYVRYGNVIYPVSPDVKHAHEFNKITSFLNVVDGNYDRWGSPNRRSKIILQAEPNTIAVTPSRESLSMTELTIDTLTGLFNKFLDGANQELEKHCEAFLHESIKNIWQNGTPKELFEQHQNHLIGVAKMLRGNPSRASSIMETPAMNAEQLRDKYLVQVYPKFNGFRAKDINARLNSLIEYGFGNRGKIMSFREAYKEVGVLNYENVWLQKNIIQPILRKMESEPTLNKLKFYAYTKYIKRDSRGHQLDSSDNMCIASELKGKNLIQSMPFLRNILILAYNRIAVYERADQFPIMKNWLGNALDSFVYICPRNTEKVKIARKFFEDQGFTILDLTKAQKWEVPDVADAPVVLPENRKIRKKGLPLLSELFDDERKTIKNSWQFCLHHDDVKRIEMPEFVIKLSGDDYQTGDLKHWTYDGVYNLIKLFGSKCGVTVNVNQHDRFIRMGAKSMLDWVLDLLEEEVQTSPGLIKLISCEHEKFDTKKWSYFELKRFNLCIPAMVTSKKLMNALGVDFSMITDRDVRLLQIWASIQIDWSKAATSRSARMTKLREMTTNIPIDSEFEIVCNKFMQSNGMQFMDIHRMVSNINSVTIKESIKNHLIDLIVYGIEG